jgi:ParB/RepB/Spo0J family partition protein
MPPTLAKPAARRLTRPLRSGVPQSVGRQRRLTRLRCFDEVRRPSPPKVGNPVHGNGSRTGNRPRPQCPLNMPRGRGQLNGVRNMKLAFIALDKLTISPANMRVGKKPPDITNILPSVRKRGVLQTLLVRPNCAPDSFEIVAGNRRFHAAKAVANENGVAEPLPCAIMEAGDDAAALEASLIENVARLDADEVTRWETFTRLVKEGRSVDEIATTFGLPELAVKRTLALGELLPRIGQRQVDCRPPRS